MQSTTTHEYIFNRAAFLAILNNVSIIATQGWSSMATRTTIRQDNQIKPSDSYNDLLPAGSTLESGATSIEYDLNSLRSIVRLITGKSNWFDAPGTNLEDLVGSADHENINSLVHNISENCYITISRTLEKVTNITIWKTPAQLIKIRELNISRTNGKLSQVVAKQYDEAGLLLITLTGSITRTTNGRLSSITYTEA